MTFTNIEKSINNLKDIIDSPILREENLRLKQKIEEMEIMYKQKVNLYEKEIISLKNKVVLKDKKIEELKGRKIKYKSRYTEEEFNVLVERKVKEKEDTVVNEAVQNAWRRRLPKLIESEVRCYPNKCTPATRDIIEKRAVELRDEMLKDPRKWPPWLKEEVNMKAQNMAMEMMDEEFDNRVRNTSFRMLSKQINEEWPKYVDNILTPFHQGKIQSQLLRLSRTFNLPCPRCGNLNPVTLTPDDIANLIKYRFIRIKCNYCKGGLSKPQFRLSLGNVLWILMNEGDNKPPPTRLYCKPAD